MNLSIRNYPSFRNRHHHCYHQFHACSGCPRHSDTHCHIGKDRCSIVTSGEKRDLGLRVNSKFPMASFWLMSLLGLAKTISLPYKSLVSFRSTVLSRSFTMVFVFADMNILLFSFFTGAHKLISPLIRSDT